jgi:hypothetical protein
MRNDLQMFLPISRLALALGLLASASALPAVPAQAATQEDVMTACLVAAGEDSTELCTCKAEQAALLVDAEMMDYIIIRMQDPQKFSEMVKAGEVPEDVVSKWPFYVRDSNAVCLADDAAEG